MVVWSCLKNIGKLNTLGSALASFKNVSNRKALYYYPVRTCHERTLPIRSSHFPLAKGKDLAMFYFMLGVIPLSLIVAYANIFIGPAQLALIPEGYEPKHWEYYQHPITRFLAKHALMSPQERYERNLHNVYIDAEISKIKKLKNKIKKLMMERLDYQSWYFITPPTKYERRHTEAIEKYKKGETTPVHKMIDEF